MWLFFTKCVLEFAVKILDKRQRVSKTADPILYTYSLNMQTTKASST